MRKSADSEPKKVLRVPKIKARPGAAGSTVAVIATQSGNGVPDESLRRAMIAEAAYYRAERRGFLPGFELEDWLASENEINAKIEGDAGLATDVSGADLH